MVSIKEYKTVSSLEEAYALNQKKGNKIIGGMCWLKIQKKNINVAIDLSQLGLDRIIENETSFKIGAMVTLRDLETHTGIKNFFGDGIENSLCHIVGTQFRNCATVGGSIHMRFGFSDILTSLMALNADVELFDKSIIPLKEYAHTPSNNDVLVNIILKKENIKMKYLSLRNSYSDLPVLAVAVSENAGYYSAVVGARPSKAKIIYDTENMLIGEITEEKATAFGAYVANNLDFGSNTRGSAVYRKHLCKVLVKRCILEINGGNQK